MTDQEYLISLSQKESYTTYLIGLRSHRDLTPQRTDTAGGDLGDTRNWDGFAISLLLYLVVELMLLCLLLFFGLLFLGGVGGNPRRVIYQLFFFFQGSGKE